MTAVQGSCSSLACVRPVSVWPFPKVKGRQLNLARRQPPPPPLRLRCALVRGGGGWGICQQKKTIATPLSLTHSTGQSDEHLNEINQSPHHSLRGGLSTCVISVHVWSWLPHMTSCSCLWLPHVTSCSCFCLTEKRKWLN